MQPLETPRLILREMCSTDVESLHWLFSDPLLMRLWPVFTQAQTEAWVAEDIRRYAQDGIGLWAMTIRGSDEAIGDCGLVRHDVDGAMETDIGWHALRAHWGQGYATEAARASRDYAFAQLGVERLVARIHPENYASRRVAEKIGMRLLHAAATGVSTLARGAPALRPGAGDAPSLALIASFLGRGERQHGRHHRHWSSP